MSPLDCAGLVARVRACREAGGYQGADAVARIGIAAVERVLGAGVTPDRRLGACVQVMGRSHRKRQILRPIGVTGGICWLLECGRVGLGSCLPAACWAWRGRLGPRQA